MEPSASFPFTSMPVRVTSFTVPCSASDMKREKLISCTFCPEFAFFTTCHNATAASRITTQKMIVFTVEFTKKLLRTAVHLKCQKHTLAGTAEVLPSHQIRCL